MDDTPDMTVIQVTELGVVSQAGVDAEALEVEAGTC